MSACSLPSSTKLAFKVGKGRADLLGSASKTLAIGLSCWIGLAAGQESVFKEKLADANLLAQIRQGGFVLYLRHGATDSSRADRAPQVDLNDCSTQRLLSDAGRKQARELGFILQRAQIPVGEVIHSPMCRARESAQLTFATHPDLLRSEPLLAYTANLTSEEKKPVIFCGDLNVAHKEIDLKNPKTNRKNAGFTDEERGKFTNLLNAGFIDTFRYFYPDAEGIYSWWSYRFSARKKNAGWRIDYFCVSESLKDRIKDAKILTEIMGSDHCPVELDFE